MEWGVMDEWRRGRRQHGKHEQTEKHKQSETSSRDELPLTMVERNCTGDGRSHDDDVKPTRDHRVQIFQTSFLGELFRRSQVQREEEPLPQKDEFALLTFHSSSLAWHTKKGKEH